MSVFTNIEAALNTRLSTLASAPPIQWPNIDFTPQQGVLFIRPTMLPATGSLITLSGQYLHKGLYQIDVLCPLNKGIATLTGWLDKIQALYATTKIITAGSDNIFVQDIAQGKSSRQDGWYVGFVTISYICYS